MLKSVGDGWEQTFRNGLGTGTLITKIGGNYNIVENTINFIEAPYGNTPIGTTTNPDPDEYDWTGITTSSSFQGRSFQRTAAPNTSNETYYKITSLTTFPTSSMQLKMSLH